MKHWNSISFRLSAVFLFFLLNLLLLGLFSTHQLGDLNQALADARDHWLLSTRILGDLNNFTSDYRAAEASELLASSPEQGATSERELAQLERSIADAQAHYELALNAGFEREIYERFTASWRAYTAIAGEVVDDARANRHAAGTALYMTQSRVAYNAASDTLAKLTALTVSAAGAASGRAAATYASARRLMLAAMALGALNLMAGMLYISRSIARPLRELAARMRALSSSETDITIEGTARQDEVGEMARAVVVFRNNAIDLAHSQRGLIQQATMLEEKLQHEQRLATMQRNFVSMASHEFRTPLTIIDGHAQRLIRTKDRLQPDEVAERAQKMRAAVLRMTSVIDNLLATSRLVDGEAGLYFHPTRIDLTALLHDVCQLHREISPGALIQERLRKPVTMVGDPDLLFQAFSNLLSNAVKYSPRSGSVAGSIQVQAIVEPEHAIVTVKDRGIGIPAHDQARLFERYFRGGNVTGITGTGIGLYLVKMVALLHRGEVSVDSTEGQGSTFIVRLPLNSLPLARSNFDAMIAADFPGDQNNEASHRDHQAA